MDVREGTLRVLDVKSGRTEWTWESKWGDVRVELNQDEELGIPLVITDISIYNPVGIRASLLREIPMEAIEIEAAGKLQAARDAEMGGLRERELRALKKLAATVPRSQLPDEFYQSIAARYRNAALKVKNPAAALADEMGRSPGTVTRWLREARKRGYLPPARRGRKPATLIRMGEKEIVVEGDVAEQLLGEEEPSKQEQEVE